MGITGMDETIRMLKSVTGTKPKQIVETLAIRGAVEAGTRFHNTPYVGDNDTKISVVKRNGVTQIRATGKSVLFIEFGSGVRYGYGHPDAAEHGYGPGTWSDGPNGHGHWDAPNGWYWTDDAGKHRSFGNPPAMAMYHAAREMRQNIPAVTEEVFKNDEH